MKKYKVYQVDVFTRERFRGNPAGIVSDAQGLTVAHMQDIAREMNCSETAFILPPESQDHNLWIRYFTNHRSSYLWTCHNSRSLCPCKGTAIYTSDASTYETGAGVLPVDIIPEGHEVLKL